MSVYYNDNDPFARMVLRANIARGRLPAGMLDGRSVEDVRPNDVREYRHCHFFAGIGGFAYGLRLAGWPVGLELWTGGFPCQDITTAGAGAGLTGARSGMWFAWLRLIAAVRPLRIWIENVPALKTRGLDTVLAALEALGYTCWPIVMGAHDVGAPLRGNRIWILATAARDRFARRERAGPLPEKGAREPECESSHGPVSHAWPLRPAFVHEIPLAADGLPGGLAGRDRRLRAIGNAVVPQVVAAIAAAWLDVIRAGDEP